MKTWISWMMILALPAVAAELRVGDAISLTLRGVPTEEAARVTGEYRVNERGEVRLPLLDDGVRAAGATTLDFALRVEAAYRGSGIYAQPRIEVAARKAVQEEGARVSVGGKVKRDGPVAFRDGLTVLQAINAAGGPDDFAGRNLYLIRAGNQYCLDYQQLEHLNIRMEPDDSLQIAAKPAFIDRWKGTPEGIAKLLESSRAAD